MKLWSAWTRDVAPHVSQCPATVIEFEIRNAAQTFFRGSRAWREVTGYFPVTAGQQTVLVEPSDPTHELVELDSSFVMLDNKRLPPITPEQLDSLYTEDWTTLTGMPDNHYCLTPNQVSLFRIPSQNAINGLKARISITVSDTATGLPDEIANRFWDAIVVGARARLMLYKNSAWYDADMAAMYGNAFSAAIDDARLDAAQAYSGARIVARSTSKWC
ncbi:MAG TPA: hypothetical protein VFV57_05965 [Limnobacter sp.]|nr:hypothetical protein [Limnobacter sp.]